MIKSAIVLGAVLPLITAATPLLKRLDESRAVFNAPVLKHFLHLEAFTSWPTNVSAIDGIRGSYPNVGGNLTGGIVGDIVNLGAANEWFPALLNGTASFYSNQWTINATVPSPVVPTPPSGYSKKDTPSPSEYATILLAATAHLTYANEFVHGFGSVTFSSSHPAFLDLNVRSFYAEIEAGFATGAPTIDVFEIKTGGKIDGSPIKALLPPGGEA